MADSEHEHDEGERRSERPGRREGDTERNVERNYEREFSRMQWAFGIFIVVCGSLIGYNTTQLNSLGARMDKFIEGQVRNDERIVAMQREYDGRITKLENQMTVQQQAYNFHFSEELAGLKVRLGMATDNKTDNKRE